MKIYSEQHQQTMLQLHLRDQKCVAYWGKPYIRDFMVLHVIPRLLIYNKSILIQK